MRQLFREEAKRLYASRLQTFLTQAAEEAGWDIFRTGFELLKGGLKNSSYVFIEHMFTKMTHNSLLKDVFDCSIKRWTQSSVDMNAFTKNALVFSRFVRQVAKFMRENLKEQSEVIDRKRKSLHAPFPIPGVEPSSSKSQETKSIPDMQRTSTTNRITRCMNQKNKKTASSDAKELPLWKVVWWASHLLLRRQIKTLSKWNRRQVIRRQWNLSCQCCRQWRIIMLLRSNIKHITFPIALRAMRILNLFISQNWCRKLSRKLRRTHSTPRIPSPL